MIQFDPNRNPILAAIQQRTILRSTVINALEYVPHVASDVNTALTKTALLNATSFLKPDAIAKLDLNNIDVNALLHLLADTVSIMFPALAPVVAFIMTIIDQLFPAKVVT